MRNISQSINKTFLAELFELEKQGEYTFAIQKVQEFWKDFNVIPDELDELGKPVLAELLLRTGALIGFLGSINQIQNSQEQSKNLLTQSHEIFLSLFNFEKVAECENYLALAYWRVFSFAEAEIWIGNSLSRRLNANSKVHLHTYIIQSLVLLSQLKYDEVVSLLKSKKNDFIKNGDDFLNGCYSSNIALAYKNIGETNISLRYLLFAQSYHKKSKHSIFLSTVENNLAQVYKTLKDYKNAHKYIDAVLSNPKSLRCKAIFLDTKALIYFDERKYAEALETVEKALSYLRGDDYNFLIDITKTKLKTLIALQKFEEAYLQFGECYKILTTYSDESIVRSFANDFHKMVSGSKHIKIYKESAIDKEEEIEFIFPKNYQSQFSQNSFVIQIHNLNLINFGIRPGMIAIAETDCEIKNGDLVAACITENSEAVVGVYSADFGIVCIERHNNIPMIFNETEIEKIGKIIGYGLPEKNFSNRETVKIKTIA